VVNQPLPPLIQEIQALHTRIGRERLAEVPCFCTIKELKERLARLTAAARTGWHMNPGDDDTRPPAAAVAA
jgi:hypothetical protein